MDAKSLVAGWRAAALLMLAALGGLCATLGSGGQATGVATLAFSNELQPGLQPTRMLLQLRDAQGRSAGQPVLPVLSRLPGQGTTFALQLALPPGRYVIDRLMGTASGPTGAAQFDLPARIELELQGGRLNYLGRIQLRATARTHEGEAPMQPAPLQSGAASGGFGGSVARLAVEDRLVDDLPELLQLWPALRGQPHALALATLAALPEQAARSDEPAAAPAGRATAPQRLAARDASGLPPALQAAFRRFLATPLPRAMSLASGGESFIAQGKGAIGVALERCRQKAGPTACQLYAVDDTLLEGNVQLQRPPATGLRAAATP